MSLTAILKNVQFLSSLSDEHVGELARIGRTQSLDAGAIVFSHGDPGDALYVILAGRARVYGRDSDGNEFEFATLGAGDFFGEIALLDGGPRSASVSCVERSELFALGREAFLSFLLRSPGLLSKLLGGLCARLRSTDQRYVVAMQLKLQAEIERLRALSQMVAGVAHEINTPLGIVSSALSVITSRLKSLATKLPPADAEAASSMEDALDGSRLAEANIARADKLIRSFKSLSVRQLVDAREKVDLGRLVDETLGLFKIKARTAGIELALIDKLLEGARDWDGYPGHLSQILLNFLTNAERYAYPDRSGGKVEVVLSPGPSSPGPTFQLSVRDFGRGIEPTHLPKIFEPFFTTGRDRGGSGLGLAIVHSLVTSSLKGTIQVESKPGEGTTFVLTIPQSVPE
jgi:signal transduction histidine kinase